PAPPATTTSSLARVDMPAFATAANIPVTCDHVRCMPDPSPGHVMSLDSSHRRDFSADSPPADAHDERLKFSGDNSFHAEFKRSGTRQRDSARMYLKTAIILSVFALTYVALVFLATNGWQALPLSIVLGVATAGIGFNIMHDGGHQAYSEHRWINRLMAMTLDVVGGSSYIWQWKHARFHHTWVNVA